MRSPFDWPRGPFKRRVGGGGAPAAFLIGYSATQSAGTDGDWFVSPDGNDAGAGTLADPFETIAAAVAAAAGGDVIRLRAGTYRETVTLSTKSGSLGNRTRIAGYGTEKPIITGAEALTGWTLCDAGDEAIVGPNYGSIYKRTITTASIASGDPRAAWLHEAGEPLNHVQTRIANPKYPWSQQAPNDWLTADETVVASALITGYRLPALTDLYTEAQIENCDVWFYATPNLGYRTPVLSFDTGTDTINLTDDEKVYSTGQTYADRFALINLLPVMQAGDWGYSVSGADTTLYLWPNDSANMAAGIEYSARGAGIVLGNASHIQIDNLRIRQVASAGAETDALYAIAAGGVTKKSNIVVENVSIENTFRADRDYAPVWLQNVDDHVVKSVTVDRAVGQFGMFLGCGSITPETETDLSNTASGGLVSRCLIVETDNSPVRLYGQSSHVTEFVTTRDCGMGAHANKANYYIFSHDCLFYGCNFMGASGYLTWQNASAISVVGCIIPQSYLGDDGRAVQDQNVAGAEYGNPAGELTLDGSGYFLNNWITPYFPAIAQTDSLSLGDADRLEVTFTGYNNIIHGDSGTVAAALDAWDRNIYTNGAARGANDTLTTAAAMYEGHALGNFALKSDSPARTFTTQDVSAALTDLAARFPQATGLDKDMTGATMNWASPTLGPLASYDATFGFDPLLIDYPSISGSPVDGSTLTCGGEFIAASPFPTITRQWQRSADGITWSNISGETGTTYALVTGDIGYYIRCAVTAGSIVAYAATSAQVASSYPLADPVVVTQKAIGGNTAYTTQQIETDSFVADGTPLVIIASFLGSASSDQTMVVTIGTPGRSFGTGTALTFAMRGRRTAEEAQVWYAVAPASGTVTVQATTSMTSSDCRIEVLEVGGMTGVGVIGTQVGGTNVSTLTPTVTTGTANSGVLHVWAHANGLDTKEIFVTAGTATEILTDRSGYNAGAATRSYWIAVGYERAAVAGAFPATATWDTASGWGRSMELLS